MTIINQEALNNRANNLGTFNGIKLVLSNLAPGPNPTESYLEVHFYNDNELANILNEIAAAPQKAKEIFPISGGHRVLAGWGTDQVQVTQVSGNPADKYLTLTVSPIGDYSTYTLKIDYQNIDPFLSEIGFKFRPGCFHNNCAPAWQKSVEPKGNPRIDYLAKDYDSFRHNYIAAMMHRIPGWEPTSEADLDIMLLELFSAAADELSDYQDRVMNEAYLTSTRKRISLARHARLMDYHIHQGNQASTYLAVELAAGQVYTLPANFTVWTGDEKLAQDSQVFIVKQAVEMHYLLNRMQLYTWSGSVPALKVGSTSAELKLKTSGEIPAKTVAEYITSGKVKYLLIQEWLNPNTGQAPGCNPEKRQLLQLLPGEAGAKPMQDPVTNEWYVRVNWEKKDQLKFNYCFTVECPGNIQDEVTLFHGNLAEIFHGTYQQLVFKEPGTLLDNDKQHYFERTDRWGALCPLYLGGSLAYCQTPPGGEIKTQTTLEVLVETTGMQKWDEESNLIHSQEDHEHFMVETDELGRSWIRFGNGINGKALPYGAIVHCTFQSGLGPAGNIGRDKLVNFDTAVSQVTNLWNPFDVTNGLAPEPLPEILRKVPEAYQYRQLRAVTLNDYVKRAEELKEVSKAASAYLWTGSWRTVRLAIDPADTTELTDKVRKKIAQHLDVVRLIGDDIEIRPPRFVPVDITLKICIHPSFWVEDIRFILEQEFSDAYTPDGRKGFFHPDCWTFGQSLLASQLIGRAQAVPGVNVVLEVDMHRWNESTPASGVAVEEIKVAENEIILVKNDPDHMEKGSIDFNIQGGRQ